MICKILKSICTIIIGTFAVYSDRGDAALEGNKPIFATGIMGLLKKYIQGGRKKFREKRVLKKRSSDITDIVKENNKFEVDENTTIEELFNVFNDLCTKDLGTPQKFCQHKLFRCYHPYYIGKVGKETECIKENLDDYPDKLNKLYMRLWNWVTPPNAGIDTEKYLVMLKFLDKIIDFYMYKVSSIKKDHEKIRFFPKCGKLYDDVCSAFSGVRAHGGFLCSNSRIKEAMKLFCINKPLSDYHAITYDFNKKIPNIKILFNEPSFLNKTPDYVRSGYQDIRKEYCKYNNEVCNGEMHFNYVYPSTVDYKNHYFENSGCANYSGDADNVTTLLKEAFFTAIESINYKCSLTFEHLDGPTAISLEEEAIKEDLSSLKKRLFEKK